MNRDQLRISQLVGDICQLAVMINQSTDMYVFVDLSGHVSTIRMHTTYKKYYKNWITDDELHFIDSDYRSVEIVIKRLTNLKMKLKKILIDKKIDLESCSYTIREEYDYHLL